MAINLNILVVTAKTIFTGDDNFQLAAGKHLKVETSPNGVDIYDGVVPAGKSWNVTVFMRIEESNI